MWTFFKADLKVGYWSTGEVERLDLKVTREFCIVIYHLTLFAFWETILISATQFVFRDDCKVQLMSSRTPLDIRLNSPASSRLFTCTPKSSRQNKL